MYFDGAVTATKVDRNQMRRLDWLTKLRQKYPMNSLADDALQLQIELEQKTATPAEMIELTQLFVTEYPNSPLKPKVMELAGRAHYALEEFPQSIRDFSTVIS